MSWRWLPTIGSILIILLLGDVKPIREDVIVPILHPRRVVHVDPIAPHPHEMLDSLYHDLPERRRLSRKRDSVELARRIVTF